MKKVFGSVVRSFMAAGMLASVSLSASASPVLIGDTLGGCFAGDASTVGLSLGLASCLATPSALSLSFVVTDPGVEFTTTGIQGLAPGRSANFAADTITIAYGADSNNSFDDLFLFTGLNVDGPVTGLTLLGSSASRVTSTFSTNSIAFLVDDVCSANCSFSVTYRIETAAQVNSVPLPGTLALVGAGLMGLGWSRRKQA